MMESLCLCERGLQRPVNQDRAGGWIRNDTGLFFVADGVGGHFAGERASQLVAGELAHWWGRGRQLPLSTAVEQLRQLAERCDGRLRLATPPGQLCAPTLVLLRVSSGAYALLWAGDSRCYQARRRLLRTTVWQLTRDDVVYGTADQGKLSQAVGAGGCQVNIRCGQVDRHTLFALCSDGVYNYCGAETLKQQLAAACRTGKLLPAMQAIEHGVLANQAPDNYSLILVRPGS